MSTVSPGPGDPFAALADPTRRRILELLVAGELSAGEVTAAVRAELGLSQPTVSQHLSVLLAAGLVTVRAEGSRRVYALDEGGLHVVRAWLDALTPGLAPALDALATEVARGRRERRSLWDPRTASDPGTASGAGPGSVTEAS